MVNSLMGVTMDYVKILYLCDRKKCDECLRQRFEDGEITSLEHGDICMLTEDKSHAQYKHDDFRVFEKVFDQQHRLLYLVEMDKKDFALMCKGEIHGI